MPAVVGGFPGYGGICQVNIQREERAVFPAGQTNINAFNISSWRKGFHNESVLALAQVRNVDTFQPVGEFECGIWRIVQINSVIQGIIQVIIDLDIEIIRGNPAPRAIHWVCNPRIKQGQVICGIVVGII